MRQKASDNQRSTDKACVSNLEYKYVTLPSKYVLLRKFHIFILMPGTTFRVTSRKY